MMKMRKVVGPDEIPVEVRSAKWCGSMLVDKSFQ